MATGTHQYAEDPRNNDILININGELFHRDEAKISVFDSGFILGDGVWEGIRLHHGRLAFIQQHMKRLYDGAKALDMNIGISPEAMVERLYATCAANNMTDGVHIRLMVTRGLKATPYQDPRVTISPATIVIIAEHKKPLGSTHGKGVKLYTSHVRRGYPDVQDPKLNTHSKLNCIFACIQAAKAQADEALMLDPHGFVATCNSTHFFIVREGEVWTSTGDFCLDGITRRNVINVCKANDIPVFERNFSLADVYAADESFITGTFAGLTPVNSVDGRTIGNGSNRMTQHLEQLYIAKIEAETAGVLQGD
ncbi:aminotransferase class IV [Alteromonas sp. ASW11-36]|uniref:branched-chain-amino-acid transaminase n=1 Tax=Alteromonas arenosi TaxID=3055817 RepID=A0ABT7SSF3_9ALTE|nr:aminotransferase class IV [Alteromonas sp. ASW11-36]MDM7859086.1 aminotransferase class IV [Alteromonas sp. ASW11-36]